MGNLPSSQEDANATSPTSPTSPQSPQSESQAHEATSPNSPTEPTAESGDKDQHKKAKKEKKEKKDENDDCLSFSADDMREQEDACASCDRVCDVLEYPAAISSKIDRDFVLNGSSKSYRWNILITSGVSASKWPHDVYQPESFAAAVNNATKEIESRGKSFVGVITRGPESGSNPMEVVDLLFFPEFVKYCDVEQTQVSAIIEYHTAVLAPRHQQFVADGHIKDDVVNEEQQKRMDELLDEKDNTELLTAAVVAQDAQKARKNGEKHQINISNYFHHLDLLTHGAGSEFPFPQDMHETSFVTLCGHTLRDKRCGVVAPILREQFEMVLDAKHPDLVPNVGIDLISHVGGHKVAGNCIIHGKGFGTVFYGRVFPEHVENIVDKTLVSGEILKPITRAAHSELW